jgi:thiamine pyrophosphate-dependent acetolactate synthase large subunit-like protein
MIKLSDYIFRYLADYGLRHIFMLTGGGAMHLNDSIRSWKHYSTGWPMMMRLSAPMPAQVSYPFRLPIKIFVLNNSGYLSIRITQNNFFGEFIGESPDSGTSFPDIVQIAAAYRLPACRIESETDNARNMLIKIKIIEKMIC